MLGSNFKLDWYVQMGNTDLTALLAGIQGSHLDSNHHSKQVIISFKISIQFPECKHTVYWRLKKKSQLQIKSCRAVWEISIVSLSLHSYHLGDQEAEGQVKESKSFQKQVQWWRRSSQNCWETGLRGSPLRCTLLRFDMRVMKSVSLAPEYHTFSWKKIKHLV